MSNFKEMFAGYTSDYLLQKRALGGELSDDAHKAIEEIFAERGEDLPPRPTAPIFIADVKEPTGRVGGGFKAVALLGVVLLSMGAGKALAHTWIGILVAIAVVVYATVEWCRKQSLTSDEREKEENAQKAEQEGLNELMIVAAEGNLVRAKELVAFGTSVNAQSYSGTTALMYAVRNGHLPVVQLLVTSGADINRSSNKGTTALAIARKFGFPSLLKF